MPIDDILAEMNATEDQQAGVDRRFPAVDQTRRQPQGRRSSGQSPSRHQRSQALQDRRQREGTLDSPKDPPTTRQRDVTRQTERQFTGEPKTVFDAFDKKVQVRADREDVGYVNTLVKLVTSVV